MAPLELKLGLHDLVVRNVAGIDARGRVALSKGDAPEFPGFNESLKNRFGVVLRFDPDSLETYTKRLKQPLIELADKLGVDKLLLKTVSLDVDYTRDQIEKMKQYLPKDSNYSRYQIDYQNSSLKRKTKIKNSCMRLWVSSVINWNGDVVPCCYDADGNFTFGNMFETSFKEVWNGSKYITFRRKILLNKTNIPMCSNCPGNLFGLTIGD